MPAPRPRGRLRAVYDYRKPGNDGKVRVIVNLAEIQYTPLSTRSPGGQQADIDGWKAQIKQLHADFAKLEVEKQCFLELARPGTGPTSSVSATGVTRSRPRLRTGPRLPCRLVKGPRDWKVRCPRAVAAGGGVVWSRRVARELTAANVSDREWSLAEPTGGWATAAAGAGSCLTAMAKSERIPFYVRDEARWIAGQ